MIVFKILIFLLQDKKNCRFFQRIFRYWDIIHKGGHYSELTWWIKRCIETGFCWNQTFTHAKKHDLKEKFDGLIRQMKLSNLRWFRNKTLIIEQKLFLLKQYEWKRFSCHHKTHQFCYCLHYEHVLYNMRRRSISLWNVLQLNEQRTTKIMGLASVDLRCITQIF